MINDYQPPPGIQAYKYVDDVSLVECRSQNQLSNMQPTVTQFSEWSQMNGMKLNPVKCTRMEISFMRDPPTIVPIRLQNCVIDCVDTVKLLGITIQKDLKWDSHIADLVKRANRKLYMLRLLKRHHLPIPDMIAIFHGYIRPILEYGVPVWSGAINKEQIATLERIQKRALRIIFGRDYTTYDQYCSRMNFNTWKKGESCFACPFSKSL